MPAPGEPPFQPRASRPPPPPAGAHASRDPLRLLDRAGRQPQVNRAALAGRGLHVAKAPFHDRGEFVAMGAHKARGNVEIVERRDQHLVAQTPRDAGRIRDRLRKIAGPPRRLGHWHRPWRPANDGPGTLPRLGVVGDAGEQPAQFDRGRELAALLISGANRGGLRFGDDEHAGDDSHAPRRRARPKVREGAA